jgi:hypothetical protein
MHVADHMQLPAEQRVDVYYAELLMDAGLTAWTSQLAGVILNDEIAARRDMVLAAMRPGVGIVSPLFRRRPRCATSWRSGP